jgi:hypothetical protein
MVLHPHQEPITAVFHAAGVVQDAALRDQNLAGMQRCATSSMCLV